MAEETRDWSNLTDQEWIEVFVSRGASQQEAENQRWLKTRYGINTWVSRDGAVGAWYGSVNLATLNHIFANEQNLAPRVRDYLEVMRLDKLQEASESQG